MLRFLKYGLFSWQSIFCVYVTMNYNFQNNSVKKILKLNISFLEGPVKYIINLKISTIYFIYIVFLFI